MSLFGGIPGIIAQSGHTVDIEREVPSADSIGGTDRTWATITSDLAAWVQPAKPPTIERYAQRNIVITHAVYFYSDPSIRIGDRLVFGTRHLLVEGVRNTAEVGELWRADCRETL